MTRAANRLGLGLSTASSHIKAVEDGLSRELINRAWGGMIPTTSGIRAYNLIRPLIEWALFTRKHIVSGCDRPPTKVSISMPECYQGTLLDAVWSEFAENCGSERPEFCLVSSDIQDESEHAVFSLRYECQSTAPPSTEGGRRIRDSWCFIRSSASHGLKSDAMAIEELEGCTIVVPRLPPAVKFILSDLAAQMRLTVRYVDIGVAALLAEAQRYTDFCTLTPLSLLHLALARQQFECIALDPSRFDPEIEIECLQVPELARAFQSLATGRFELSHALTLSLDRHGRPIGETISLKYSRSFLTLYEEGNVGRAAQRLCIVQPALTIQLRQMEHQFGGNLFERTSRGLLATPLADRVYECLRPLVADFDKTIKELRRVLPLPLPRVRAGLMPSVDEESVTASRFVAGLQRWMQAYGANPVEVIEAFSGELVQWLKAGKIDFAIVDRKFADPLLDISLLLTDPMTVVVDAKHHLLPPGPVRLSELRKLPFVLPSERHGLRDLISRHLQENRCVLKPKMEVDSMVTALQIIKTGPFATILPEGAIQKSSSRRGLSVHEICEPRIVRQVCLVRDVRTAPSQLALDLMQEIREAFAEAAVRDRIILGTTLHS